MSGWKLSGLAREDLVDMFRYGLETFGPEQAERYRTGIDRTFESLTMFPHMARLRTEFRSPLRVHHHIRHYIAYTVETDYVLIVRIVRDDADLDLLFDNLD